jgi:hypothetical protein
MPNRTELLVAALLMALTAATFWPVLNCQFVSFDDPRYILNNPDLRQGLSPGGIGWAFTTNYFANWHPLTWLSYLADYQFYGIQPRGYHAGNLALHVANVVVLFLVLARLTGDAARAALVAALFAVHPLRVESVAWISERKDVLSALFGLAAIGAYVGWVRAPSPLRYALVLVLFALSLMAKPMLVTLPCVLLLLDFWPLGRLRFGNAQAVQQSAKKNSTAKPSPPAQRPPLALVVEKLPLFALSIASSAATVWAQQQGGAVQTLDAFPLNMRLANVLVSYARYVEKMLRFDELAIFYPYPEHWPTWLVAGSAVLLVLITALAIWRLRPNPWLAVGWFWYLGTLVPVIGLVQVGAQSLADRYTYFPVIGILLMVVLSLPDALFRTRAGRVALGLAAACLLAVLCVSTQRQIAYWQDSESLFSHALAVAPSVQSHQQLGEALVEKQRPAEALEQFGKGIAIKPNAGL